MKYMEFDKKKYTTQLSFDEIWDESKDLDESKEIANDQTEFESHVSSDTFSISLVRDFDVFLDFIQNHSVSLTKTKEFISRKYLPALNELMSVQHEAASSNTDQEYYPYIHFFYFLAISGGMLEKVPAKAGKLQLKETERLRLFKELTEIEKYFFLLETFWIDVNWATLLDTHFYLLSLPIQEVLSACSLEQPNRPILIWNNETVANTIIAMGLYKSNYLQLYFEWFEIWKCETNQERINGYFRNNGYFAKSITLTTFGSKMIPILLLERNLNIWNTAIRRESGEPNPIPGSELEDMLFGQIPQEIEDALNDRMGEDQSCQPFFQPFVDLFPNKELKRTLPRNKRKFIDGIYTFKVTHTNSVWRKVVLTGKHTMDDLHEMIIHAFDFNDDHLYSFFMDGKKWSNDCIVSPHDDSGHPNADKIKIGDVGLHSKKRFLYLFDYGDEWTFVVEVDQIEEIESVPFKPYVKEGKGESPKQYGFYEDEIW